VSLGRRTLIMFFVVSLSLIAIGLELHFSLRQSVAAPAMAQNGLMESRSRASGVLVLLLQFIRIRI
jgi:hypothetical protein